jgi:hypothetical protein
MGESGAPVSVFTAWSIVWGPCAFVVSVRPK